MFKKLSDSKLIREYEKATRSIVIYDVMWICIIMALLYKFLIMAFYGVIIITITFFLMEIIVLSNEKEQLRKSDILKKEILRRIKNDL